MITGAGDGSRLQYVQPEVPELGPVDAFVVVVAFGLFTASRASADSTIHPTPRASADTTIHPTPHHLPTST